MVGLVTRGGDESDRPPPVSEPFEEPDRLRLCAEEKFAAWGSVEASRHQLPGYAPALVSRIDEDLADAGGEVAVREHADRTDQPGRRPTRRSSCSEATPKR